MKILYVERLTMKHKIFVTICVIFLICSCNYFQQNSIHCDAMDDLIKLEQCAQNGNASSQYNLGARYLNGLEAPKDLNKAFYWTEKAAKQGYPAAESNLGWLYSIGAGTEKDNAKAFEWTERAAKKGNILAYVNLGYFYSYGIGVPVDWEKSTQYYQLAATHNIPIAYQNLGMAYFYGKGVEQNTGKAIELTNKAIEDGSKEALYNLSRMYLSINKEDEAAAMLRQAANIGIPKAQAELASLLSKAAKTNAEKIEAKQWLEKALIQEDPYAYAVAGLLYSQKNQVFPYDEAKAFEYLMKASDMGEETSKHMIGAWYWTGKYVSKDEKNALKWIEDAANHGDIKAVERLVRIYEKGSKEIPKNEIKAKYWQNKLGIK